MVTFNPRKKTENASGPGRIKLGENAEAQKQADTSAGDKPKWAIPAAIGGGVAAIGLAGYFMLASGGEDVTPPAPPPVVIVQPPATVNPPAQPPFIAPQPQVPTQAAILADSIAAKRDSVYLDRVNAMYDAYITPAGREARVGEDFAAHVGLFEKGGVSVLVTEGPYAGTRIGFFPLVLGSEGRFRVSVEKVGEIVQGADGRTPQFRTLPVAAQTEREIILSANAELQRARESGFPNGAMRGDVTIPAGTKSFEKQVRENGEWYPAFWLHGSPAQDGIFSVEIWNGDSYAINLNTGEFTINSLYLFHPDVDRLIDIAYDPSHPEYLRVRNAAGCDTNPDRDCNVVTRGVTFPNVVNGSMPGVAVAPVPTQGFAPRP